MQWLKEGQTMQWLKENGKANNDLQYITQKIEDRAT
jgi:hypothetical protein